MKQPEMKQASREVHSCEVKKRTVSYLLRITWFEAAGRVQAEYTRVLVHNIDLYPAVILP